VLPFTVVKHCPVAPLTNGDDNRAAMMTRELASSGASDDGADGMDRSEQAVSDMATAAATIDAATKRFIVRTRLKEMDALGRKGRRRGLVLKEGEEHGRLQRGRLVRLDLGYKRSRSHLGNSNV
jgi:hypothetical protein